MSGLQVVMNIAMSGIAQQVHWSSCILVILSVMERTLFTIVFVS